MSQDKGWFTYPKWFPYPSCWLRAIVLNISGLLNILAATIFFYLTVFFVGFTGAVLDASDRDFFVNALLLIWIFLIVIVVPIAVLSLLDRLMWNRPKKDGGFFLKRNNWFEGIFAYLVLTVISLSIVTVFGLLFCRHYYINGDYYFLRRECNRQFSQHYEAIAICTTIAFAYAYQGRYLFLEWRKERQQRKNKRVNRLTLPRAKRPARVVEDGDREFNDFRQQQKQNPQPSQSSKTIDEELEELRKKLED